ncbi:MAG: hypothetical protein ACPGGA_03775 [Balneolaceae bacterium]
MKKIYHLLFIAFYLLIVSCTNDDAQQKFESQAYGEASNYTETNFQGDIVRADSDDWRISPLYVGLASVQPVFPNPVQYGSNINLEVELNGAPVSTIIELGYLNESNAWFPLQIQDITSDFELVTFFINTRQFGNSAEQARGIHRLLLFDGNQRLISYGDLLIQ